MLKSNEKKVVNLIGRLCEDDLQLYSYVPMVQAGADLLAPTETKSEAKAQLNLGKYEYQQRQNAPTLQVGPEPRKAIEKVQSPIL